jgi:hypothetical protein
MVIWRCDFWDRVDLNEGPLLTDDFWGFNDFCVIDFDGDATSRVRFGGEPCSNPPFITGVLGESSGG